MPDSNLGIYGAVSNFFIAALAILGFKGRLDNLDKRKVEKDAFKEYKISIDKQFQNVNRQLEAFNIHLEAISLDLKQICLQITELQKASRS